MDALIAATAIMEGLTLGHKKQEALPVDKRLGPRCSQVLS